MIEDTITKKIIEYQDFEIALQSGDMAVNGAVTVALGNTRILCTCVVGGQLPTGFAPTLYVEYNERLCAAGRIPGGFFKREQKPNENQILISRFIDKVIRSMLPRFLNREIQVSCTVLSYDLTTQCPTDVPAAIGAIAAVILAGIPIKEVVGVIRACKAEEVVSVVNTNKNIKQAACDLAVVGTMDSILVIDGGAKEVPYNSISTVLHEAHTAIQTIIQSITEFCLDCGGSPNEELELEIENTISLYKNTLEQIKSLHYDSFLEALSKPDKKLRTKALGALHKAIKPSTENDFVFELAFQELTSQIKRSQLFESNTRSDGRQAEEMRPISAIANYLPDPVHGSGLFMIGKTQVLSTVTIGNLQADAQMQDDLRGVQYENFIVHCSVPPHAAGEVKKYGAPSRREIAHGRFSLRALSPVLPSKEAYSHTMRISSMVLSSENSWSDESAFITTVPSASMALMSCGVPITGHVAGIRICCVKNSSYLFLIDATEEEDQMSDGDFKITATEIGVTSVQMDSKVGIASEVILDVINQSKTHLDFILSKLNAAILASGTQEESKTKLQSNFTINKGKIRDVIGLGGNRIRSICEDTGTQIKIEQTGNVIITGSTQKDIDRAGEIVIQISQGPEIGVVYTGKITKIVDFGLFVRFMGYVEGMVHISEISNSRIEDLRAIFAEGEEITVRVTAVDRGGRIRLSAKQLGNKPDLNEITETEDVSITTAAAPEAPAYVHSKKKRFF